MKKQNHRTDYTDEEQLNYANQQQTDIEERLKSNGYCCFDCGVKYLTEEQKNEGGVSTFHYGICCVCQEEKAVTHIRAYNWLREIKTTPNEHGDDNFSIPEDHEYLKL